MPPIRPDVKFVPIYEADRQGSFVDTALVQPWLVEIAPGVNVETAPLKADSSHSLLELSQTDVLIKADVLRQDDFLRSSATVDELWLQDTQTGEVWKATEAGTKLNQITIGPVAFAQDTIGVNGRKILAYLPDRSSFFVVEVSSNINVKTGQETTPFLPANNRYKVLGYSLNIMRAPKPIAAA